MKKYKLIILGFAILSMFFYVSSVKAFECFPNYVCGSWGGCEDGIQTRVCEDNACGKREIVERSFCNKPDCTPRIECGPWGSCVYTEKTDSLIKGKISFGGYRSRTCEDANGCVKSFIQEGACEETYSLHLTPITRCNQNFLAVSDPASEREVAKINIDSWKSNRLDIAFVQGTAAFCPSCYNTVKDANEDGIDCGGECKPCKKEQKYILTISLILLWSVSALFSALSVREIVLLKKTGQNG